MENRIFIYDNSVCLFAPQGNESRTIAYRSETALDGDFYKAAGISPADTEFISESLSDINRRPLLVRAGRNPAFISTAMYRSSGLCLAVIPQASPDAASEICGLGGFGGIAVSPAFSKPVPKKRLSEESRDTLFRSFDSILPFCTAPAVLDNASYYKLMTTDEKLTAAAGQLVGCRIDIDPVLPLCSTPSDYNIGLFSGFILATAFLIRRAATEHRGNLRFLKTGDRLLASVTADLIAPTSLFEYSPFEDRFADSSYSFVCFAADGTLHAELCQQSPDLSLLGLKDNPTLR